MRKLRSEMIRVLVGIGWTQDKIAQLTDMSQPAVSKQVTKYRADGTPPPMELALDQQDIPWLEGRLWGLAEEISRALDEAARCTPCVHALARGKKRFTPQNVDALRRLIEEDLRLDRARLPSGHRDAYDHISRGLDVPTKKTTTTTTGPSALRRTLARQIQRDRLNDDA
jgi:hypothetical protein